MEEEQGIVERLICHLRRVQRSVPCFPGQRDPKNRDNACKNPVDDGLVDASCEHDCDDKPTKQVACARCRPCQQPSANNVGIL